MEAEDAANPGWLARRGLSVGLRAFTEVGRHPWRTVYISAVAQRGRHAELYPFHGHVSAILSIREREGWGGLLKGSGPRVAAEGLRVLLGADSKSEVVDVGPRRRQGRRRQGGEGAEERSLVGAGEELLGAGGRALLVSVTTHPLEVLATRLMTEDDSEYSSVQAGVRVILEAEGWAGFYRGFQATLLLQSIELLRDRVVGDWRQQLVDWVVEMLGYTPDSALPQVDADGFPLPPEPQIDSESRGWWAFKMLIGVPLLATVRVSLAVCRTRLVLAHSRHDSVIQALLQAAPLTAESRNDLMAIGWATAWGWLPMTLGGLVTKLVASAVLNPARQTDPAGRGQGGGRGRSDAQPAPSPRGNGWEAGGHSAGHDSGGAHGGAASPAATGGHSPEPAAAAPRAEMLRQHASAPPRLTRQQSLDDWEAASGRAAGSGRRVCGWSTFDPVRQVNSGEQLSAVLEAARRHEQLGVLLLTNPSCPKCRELRRQFSLVAVATTEQTPLAGRSAAPIRAGSAADGSEHGRNPAQAGLPPSAPQLATFAEIPSCGSGGACAHFQCPLTGQPLVDPVCDKDDVAYERTAILQHLASGNGASPVTKGPPANVFALPHPCVGRGSVLRNHALTTGCANSAACTRRPGHRSRPAVRDRPRQTFPFRGHSRAAAAAPGAPTAAGLRVLAAEAGARGWRGGCAGAGEAGAPRGGGPRAACTVRAARARGGRRRRAGADAAHVRALPRGRVTPAATAGAQRKQNPLAISKHTDAEPPPQSSVHCRLIRYVWPV